MWLHILHRLSAVHLFLPLSAFLHSSLVAPTPASEPDFRRAPRGRSQFSGVPPDAVKGHVGGKKKKKNKLVGARDVDF